jgi:fatty acid desaturase
MPDAPAGCVPAALRELVRAERLAQPSASRTAVHLGVIAAAWTALACVGLSLDSPVAWLPIWAALALLTATPLALMHEAVHHNLFRGRRANQVAGTIAAAAIFLHGPAYRAFHLTHHAYTFRNGDSEQLPARFRSRLAYLGYCAALGPGFVVVLWAGALATAAGRPPRWAGTAALQRDVRRWALAPLLVLAPAALATAVWPAIVVHVWLVPAVLGVVVVFPLLTLPEHYGGHGKAQLTDNTRTSRSNALLRYVYWNNNFHTAHHMAPMVPPHRIARVDAFIEGDNTLRETGFIAFHRHALAALPWLPPRGFTLPHDVDVGATTGPRPAPPGRVERVSVETAIDPRHVDVLWGIYVEAFSPMRERAVLNHLYPRDVFDDLVNDPRVLKIVGWNDDEPVALSLLTDALELVPQISPPFLARRFPEQAQRHAVLFCIFVCIAERSRSKTMFPNIMMAIAEITAERGGVVITDMSRLNRDAGVHEAIARTAGRFAGSGFEEIDSQHYFAAVIPRPLGSPTEQVIDLREGQTDATAQTTPAADGTPASA